MTMQTTTCRKCGALIVFIKTARGKQMPCDAEAIAIMPVEGTPAGVSRDVVSGLTPAGNLIAGRRATDDEVAANPNRYRVHVSHFATCPNAAEFRKRNAKEGAK